MAYPHPPPEFTERPDWVLLRAEVFCDPKPEGDRVRCVRFVDRAGRHGVARPLGVDGWAFEHVVSHAHAAGFRLAAIDKVEHGFLWWRKATTFDWFQRQEA